MAEMQKYKFPDETEDVKDGDEFEIEIEDDTPEADRNRQPMPKELVDDLDKDDLEQYDDNVKQKLKQIVSEGVTVKQEIQVLTEGLNDTIKSIAEELDVSVGEIKQAINIALKGNWDQVWKKFDTIETILDITGHAVRKDDGEE